MDFDGIVAKLRAKWPEIEAPKVDVGDRVAISPTSCNFESLKYLKEDPELAFDSLMTLAGADTGRELWVVYALHSFKHFHKILVKAVLPRENPEIESVCALWSVANFFEREAYDLYGIKFKNHPDLRRIMNPIDWVGWPGRKDYEYPSEYHGVPTLREDQFFIDKVDADVAARQGREKEMLEKAGIVEKK